LFPIPFLRHYLPVKRFLLTSEMNYSRFIPSSTVSSFIDSYWAVQGEDTAIQKITPDGFTELIVHLGDPYFISDHPENTFTPQPKTIIAGQLSTPIYLRPSGKSDIIGIKFTATGIWKSTGLKMDSFTDKTVDMASVLPNLSQTLLKELSVRTSTEDRIKSIDNLFIGQFLTKNSTPSLIDRVVDRIQKSNGTLSVRQLTEEFNISSRTLERSFNEQVGISAKQFSRLVRFNYVFALLQQPELTKSDIAFLAGYFDQAHFNNEFRQFTNENPEFYFKQNHAFANFFMNRV
jgi:AraC-like DNA-binding protein